MNLKANWYRIKHSSGRFLTDTSSGKSDLQVIITKNFEGNDGQLWRVVNDDGAIGNKGGNVLDIHMKDTKEGTEVWAQRWNKGKNQIWYQDEGSILSLLNKFALDVDGDAEGAGVIMMPFSGQPNQSWEFQLWDPQGPQGNTWEIYNVGWEYIIGVPDGMVKQTSVSHGLETESKEDDTSETKTFTEAKWGVSAQASASAEWGFAKVEGKVSSYSKHQSQQLVDHIRHKVTSKYQSSSVTKDTTVTGPMYIRQAVVIFKNITTNATRVLRSKYYVVSTKTPNEDINEIIDMEKF